MMMCDSLKHNSTSTVLPQIINYREKNHFRISKQILSINFSELK